MHADPLAWLRANSDGVVIVDSDLAAEQLRDARPFLVDGDSAFGLSLREMLTPRSPNVLVILKEAA